MLLFLLLLFPPGFTGRRGTPEEIPTSGGWLEEDAHAPENREPRLRARETAQGEGFQQRGDRSRDHRDSRRGEGRGGEDRGGEELFLYCGAAVNKYMEGADGKIHS